MSPVTDPIAFFNQTFQTSFGNTTSIKNHLIGQTAFSTMLGSFVCRLPLFQSAVLGLATEGCRYVTDKAVEHLSSKFTFIRNNQTAVKTALVAGSFFLTHGAIKAILPSSCGFIAAGSLMTATYLFAEPIVNRTYEACTTEKSIKRCLDDIKDDLGRKYGPTYLAAKEKINAIWNSFGGNRLGNGDST
ncbi:MAG: hypothetical protein ACRDDW_03015 [Candidatus Rhabdochlamydia sp.]